jgi:hypothetical protein
LRKNVDAVVARVNPPVTRWPDIGDAPNRRIDDDDVCHSGARPALTKELKVLLMRTERPDLAAQMDALTLRGEERSRRDRRRTFYEDRAPRRYSLDIDLRGSVAILDIDAARRIVALHLLEGGPHVERARGCRRRAPGDTIRANWHCCAL